MLKMRQWQGTLDRVKAIQGHCDVAIDGSIEIISKQNNKNVDGVLTSRPFISTKCYNGSKPLMGLSALNFGKQIEVDKELIDTDDIVIIY